jgi:ABC-2 type transport system ATP-binding protein
VGRLTDILAFQVRGWELVMANLRPEVLAGLAPRLTKTTEISSQRYALELPLDVAPEQVLADLTAAGASLVSLNPVRDTLEDFFVRRVAEVGEGARSAPQEGPDAGH